MVLTASLIFTLPAQAQTKPQGSHVCLYFPQLADGGDATSRWQTTFIFTNPNSSSAIVDLLTYNNDGTPLSIDLESGARTRHSFALPANGSRVLRSRTTSQTTVIGWAAAYATIAVQGIVSYRQFVGGVPKQEISAQATLPTTQYLSPANRFLGVAIANVFNNAPVTVDLIARNSEGQQVGSTQVTVPALGHTAFILSEKFPSLGETYGTLKIVGNNLPYDEFVAWTLGADSSNIWSSLPPGAYSWPVTHWDRIWLVYLDVVNVALAQGVLTTVPELRIISDREINAKALNGNTIEIYRALSELISDSPSELAYAIGHEMGHIFQQRNNDLRVFDTTNSELDADVWGVILAILAGYDPYGIAGTLGKLSMASGEAGLIMQFGHELFDVHRSFNTRLEKVFNSLNSACNSSTDLKSICDTYKKIVHPSFPPNAPLAPAKPGS
jgi:hypothetical protein